MNIKHLVVSSLFLVGAAQAATVRVTITVNSVFSPEKVQIHSGDIVEFVNESTRKHTVTADASLAQDPANVILPAGAAPFNSGTVAPGKAFTHLFTTVGLYQYLCLPHESHGMRGQIDVLANETEDQTAFETDFEAL